jgi:hypothetical protein
VHKIDKKMCSKPILKEIIKVLILDLGILRRPIVVNLDSKKVKKNDQSMAEELEMQEVSIFLGKN